MDTGTKEALRARQTALLGALGAEERRRSSEALAGHLAAWAPARGFETVLTVLPFPEEPDLTPFLTLWLASGRGLGLAWTGPGRHLGFRLVDSLAGPWAPRPYGLREPGPEHPEWTPGSRTLVLVPGLAFGPGPGDRVARLGRGAGYYDRWLGAHGAAVTALGVGFSSQWVDFVPLEAHDRTLEGWLDPEGFRVEP